MDDLTGSVLHACARYISNVCFGEHTDSLNVNTELNDVTSVDKKKR